MTTTAAKPSTRSMLSITRRVGESVTLPNCQVTVQWIRRSVLDADGSLVRAKAVILLVQRGRKVTRHTLGKGSVLELSSDVDIEVSRLEGGRASLTFHAPPSVVIKRTEVLEASPVSGPPRRAAG